MEHLILPTRTAKRTRRTVLNFSTIGWWWRKRISIYIVILQTTSSTSFHSVTNFGWRRVWFYIVRENEGKVNQIDNSSNLSIMHFGLVTWRRTCEPALPCGHHFIYSIRRKAFCCWKFVLAFELFAPPVRAFLSLKSILKVNHVS